MDKQYTNTKLNSEGESKTVNNLLIIDPNGCDQELVPIEDLNISVELSVYRRTDDIIIFNLEEKDASFVKLLKAKEE